MKKDKKFRQRIGYGAGDMACNLVWQMITLYLMYYYTDVYGLAAAQVSLLFLLTRCVDGVTDVIMGVLIDKTNTKYGKSRPWFLIGAIPFCILGILAFYVPDLGEVGKLIYAYITYIGLSCAYTMVNIPLASILPSLTSDENERTILVCFRMVMAAVGGTIVSALTLPLVHTLGGGNAQNGFFYTMIIFSVVAGCLFFFTFTSVEETVKMEKEDISAKEAFKAIKGNKPWYIFAINIIFMWGSVFMMQGSLIYYYTYYVGNVTLAATVASIFTFIPVIASIIAPLFTKLSSKRNIFQLASFINIVGFLVIYVMKDNIPGIIIGAIILSFGYGLRQVVYFSMQADPVDYGEYKTGISAAGLLSSINGFLGKVTLALAGSFTGVLLAISGYIPNGTQPDNALIAIQASYIFIPVFLVILSMITMSFYDLDKVYPKIRAELDSRTKGVSNVKTN